MLDSSFILEIEACGLQSVPSIDPVFESGLN